MRSLFSALVVLAAVLGPAAPALAREQPCIPGTSKPLCHVWTGKAISVGDGDTVDVNVAGDGTRAFKRVRVTGIQAMELTRYSYGPRRRRGACHSLAATARMEQLVEGRRVRLLAQDPGSTTGHRQRPRRALLVRRGGRWIDPAAVLVREGHALWFPNGVEWAWNRLYHGLAKQAAAAHRNLYNRVACGRGPGRTEAPFLSIRWDAAGVDGQNINGEWGRVYNLGPRPLRIGGWWFRDSHLRRYRFPRRTVVPPRGRVTVHIGRGRVSAGHLFWGLNQPVFENASFGSRWIGDGGYLFDPQGDLRAWALYP